MIEFDKYGEIIASLNCLTNDMLLRMAETTIPKDWSEVRAAVNLVERGVKVLLNNILNKKTSIRFLSRYLIMSSIKKHHLICFICSG